jgi:hypothetical protein
VNDDSEERLAVVSIPGVLKSLTGPPAQLVLSAGTLPQEIGRDKFFASDENKLKQRMLCASAASEIVFIAQA